MTRRDDIRPDLSSPATVAWEIAEELVPYDEAVARMDREVCAIARGEAPERIWLLQHPPLYTAGTSANESDLMAPDRFPVFKTGRGGQYTYHGPGQRVAYVMLDLKRRGGDVRAFVTGLEQWIIDTLHESETFVRLRVVASDTVLVDVAIDVAPGRPPLLSVVGPTFELEELAGRKLLALFDRAQARDFVDVYALVGRFGAKTLLERAGEVDLGFDRGVLAAMIRTLDRYRDDELPVTDAAPAVLRAFFTAWANDLEAAT